MVVLERMWRTLVGRIDCVFERSVHCGWTFALGSTDASRPEQGEPDASIVESPTVDLTSATMGSLVSQPDDAGLGSAVSTNTTVESGDTTDAGCFVTSPAQRYSFTGNGTQVPNLSGAGDAELRGRRQSQRMEAV